MTENGHNICPEHEGVKEKARRLLIHSVVGGPFTNMNIQNRIHDLLDHADGFWTPRSDMAYRAVCEEFEDGTDEEKINALCVALGESALHSQTETTVVKKEGDFSSNLSSLLELPTLEFDGGFHLKKEKLQTEELTQILTKTAGILNEGVKNHSISMWVLGNIASILDDQEVDFSWVAEQTEYALNTIQSARRTYEYFGGVKEALPWSHHKELAHMRGIDAKLGRKIAQEAVTGGWSVSTLRKVGKAVRSHLGANEGKMTRELNTIAEDAITTTPTTRSKTFLRFTEEGPEFSEGPEAPIGPGLIVEVKRVVQAA